MKKLALLLQNQLIIRKPASFHSLPLEMVEKILEDTDLSSRLVLRKISRNLRILVDKQDPSYKLVEIKVNMNCVELNLEGRIIYYRRANNGFRSKIHQVRKTTHEIIERMLRDLLTFMSNPKFHLEKLRITFTDDHSYKIFVTLLPKIFTFQISVGYFFIKVQNGQEHGPVVALLKMDDVQLLEFNYIDEMRESIIGDVTMKYNKLVDPVEVTRINKYYRKGHEELVVEHPALLPPIRIPVRSSRGSQEAEKPWNPFFSKLNILG